MIEVINGWWELIKEIPKGVYDYLSINNNGIYFLGLGILMIIVFIISKKRSKR